MNSRLHRTIPARIERVILPAAALLVIGLLLAGCSFGLPPGIPQTGTGTGTPVTPTLTLLAVQSSTPNAAPTLNVITATSSAVTNTTAPANSYPAPATSTPPAAATTAAPPPVATTAVPQAATTAAPPAATTVAPTTSNTSGSIPLPSQLQTIQFVQNTSSYVVTANLQSGSIQGYRLYINANQHMYLTTDGNVSISVYDPNGTPFTGKIQVLNPTRFNLTQAGNYSIAMQGTGQVAMAIYIPPVGADWTQAVPVPKDMAPIQFASGATSATINANISQGVPVGYTIGAQAGQRMTVTTNGNAVAFLTNSNKDYIPSANAPAHQFIFPLQNSDTYFLVLMANGPASVTVSIPALNVPPTGGQGTPIPVPGTTTRVSFGTGNASATVNTSLTAGQPKGYVITVQAGQTLYVSTTGKVDVTAYGPGNAMLVNGHADFPNRWTIPASQAGDYTFVISGSGATTLTFYVPPK